MVLGEEPFQRGFINWSVDRHSLNLPRLFLENFSIIKLYPYFGTMPEYAKHELLSTTK